MRGSRGPRPRGPARRRGLLGQSDTGGEGAGGEDGGTGDEGTAREGACDGHGLLLNGLGMGARLAGALPPIDKTHATKGEEAPKAAGWRRCFGGETKRGRCIGAGSVCSCGRDRDFLDRLALFGGLPGQDCDFLDRFCGWPRGLGEKPAGRLAALFGPRVGAGGNWSRKSQSCPRFASGPPNRSRKSRSCPLWEAVGGWQVLLSVVWSCRDQWLFWAEVAALRFRACYSWLPTSPCTTASSSSREVTPSLR